MGDRYYRVGHVKESILNVNESDAYIIYDLQNFEAFIMGILHLLMRSLIYAVCMPSKARFFKTALCKIFEAFNSFLLGVLIFYQSFQKIKNVRKNLKSVN